MSCKIVMVIISSAICLAGVVAVIIGALVENKSEPIDGNLRYKDKSQIILLEFLHLANVGSLLIGIGSIITIIGFLGCCGAMFENKGMLMIFFISMLIMVMVEVMAVAIVLSNFQTATKLMGLCTAVTQRYRNGIFNNLWNSLFNTDTGWCFHVVVEWVKSNSALIGIVAFFIIAIEIAAMIVSMVLYKNLPGNLQVFSAAC